MTRNAAAPDTVSLAALSTESAAPEAERLHRAPAAEIAALMAQADAQAAAAAALAAPAAAKAAELAAQALDSGGRLIYIGAGTSGRLGVLDAVECPPTFGVDPDRVVGVIAGGAQAFTHAVEGAEDSPDLGAADIDALGVGPNDVVVGLAASGRTPYVRGGLDRARSFGAKTVSVACVAGAAISQGVDVAIEAPTGPEILAGSTRLKAGSAQKMILNMISTIAMTQIGKVWRGRMVDLKATNAKLRARAARTTAELGETSLETAETLLQSCDWEVKTAVFCALTGAAPLAARAQLTKARGRLDRALEATGDV